MPSHQADAPASSWGLIIGKGGQNMKKLENDFNVKIRIPRASQSGWITLTGAPDACLACDEAIQKIVQSNSRGKDRPRGNKPTSKSEGETVAFPSKCILCDAGITGAIAVYEHLGSKKHLQKIQETNPPELETIPDPEVRRSVLEVAALFSDPTYRAFHEKLGYDVGQILILAPKEAERRQAAEALVREIALVSPDPDWIKVDFRTVVLWDDSLSEGRSSAQPLFEAPSFEDMVQRVHLEPNLPMIRMPKLPAALPRMDKKLLMINSLGARHMYPCTPSSRLGVAVIRKLGLCLKDFDVVCGTSFIKALSGDITRTRDDFYLQRAHEGILVCLHVPKSFHSTDTTGHAVERLLCGASRDAGCCVAVTSLRIASTRFLVTSELDAMDSKGNWVEVKSTSSKQGKAWLSAKVGLQVALNGSKFLLGCMLNADKSHLEAVEWLDVEQSNLGEGFVLQGQRARLMLDQVLKHELLNAEGCGVVKLTFDGIKSPILEFARTAVGVLPHGLV